MKFLVTLALCVLGGVKAQGYNPGNVAGLVLPNSLSTSSSSTTTSTFTSSVSTPTFPNADFNRLNQLRDGSSQLTAQQVSRTTIVRAQNQLSSPVESFQSVFNRFPSDGQIAELVNSGDVGALVKLLQNIATDNSVPCAAKVTYLLNLLGATKDGIRRKTLNADQLVGIIDGAKAQIARLNDQINRLQRERDALGIPNYESRVRDLSSRLNNFNSQVNSVRVQIAPEQARVLGFQKQIQNYQRQNENERDKLVKNRVRLAEVDNTIKDIQNKIRENRQTRASLQASISNSQNVIRANQRTIQDYRRKIADVASRIRSLKDTVDNLKRQTNTLEVDMERARTNLSIARTKDNKIANDIRRWKDKIEALRPNLRDDDLRSLRNLVNSLNGILPNISKDVDREYYYCYGAGKVETVTTGNTVVYVVRGDVFGQYVGNVYGGNLASNLQLGQNQSIRLQVVDPFSPIWTSKFGLSYRVGGQGQVLNDSSFSCLDNGGSLSTGRGRITSIQGNEILVSGQDGRQSKLSVGGCSRLQATSSLPQVGQNVLWRGTPSAGGGYSLYAATCW